MFLNEKKNSSLESDLEQQGDFHADSNNDEFENIFKVLFHELNSPVAVIIGASTILKDKIKDSQLDNTLSIIERNAYFLYEMICQLKNTSKVLFKRNKLLFVDVDFDALIRSVVDSYQILAERKKQSLILINPKKIGCILADPIALQQVFRNLLENALKYTPDEGKITVSVEDQINKITVKVQDNGIGIDPKNLSKVFERFWRENQKPAIRGLGLGLSLAQDIINRHKGDISVDSPGPGKGSIFTVVLFKQDQDQASDVISELTPALNPGNHLCQ